MRVLIAGGSGFLGRHLTRSLLDDGHQVWVLSRKPEQRDFRPGVESLAWDGRTTSGWGKLVNEIDAIVNLAGSTIGRWPWTERRKQQFWESRVWSGEALTEAIRAANHRPSILLQQSGGGYYGPHGDESVTEATPAGNDFSARLCQAWEASSQSVEELGVRRVVTRTGIVISRDAEVLRLMALPIRLFIGGKLGSGRQGIGWIHLQDEIRAFRFLMDNPDSRGVYNLAAPQPVSNADFMRGLAETLKRPYWFHTPAFLLRLVLGEMSTLLLDGWFMRPERILAEGFKFDYRELRSALNNL